jgi:GcrA cell cycle regulator
MDWTPEQITQLTQLWREGLSTAEIGKRLGISKNAVVGKAHRLPAIVRHTTHARPAVPAAAAAPAPQPAPPPRVVELSNQTCRWPIGHPGDADFHFCTQRAIQGKPYCVEHSAVAYVKAKPKAGEAA